MRNQKINVGGNFFEITRGYDSDNYDSLQFIIYDREDKKREFFASCNTGQLELLIKYIEIKIKDLRQAKKERLEYIKRQQKYEYLSEKRKLNETK